MFKSNQKQKNKSIRIIAMSNQGIKDSFILTLGKNMLAVGILTISLLSSTKIVAEESSGFYAASLGAANRRCRERGYSHAVKRPDMSGGVFYFCVKQRSKDERFLWSRFL